MTLNSIQIHWRVILSAHQQHLGVRFLIEVVVAVFEWTCCAPLCGDCKIDTRSESQCKEHISKSHVPCQAVSHGSGEESCFAESCQGKF